MTDRITKALNKLSSKERSALKSILNLIKVNKLQGLDLKKLKGHDDIFRVRKGNMRVIFRKQDTTTHILTVERRNENTYQDF